MKNNFEKTISNSDSIPFAQITTNTTGTFYLKTTKPGKLYKGTVNNAFTKSQLGSIPTQKEKILIETKLNNIDKPSPGPGPGDYETKSSFNVSHKQKQITGKGFLSSTERFNSLQLFRESYRPGPGDYKIEDDDFIKKKHFGNSLYNSTQTSSILRKQTYPGPGSYSPIHTGDLTSMNGGKSSFFASTSIRGKEAKKDKIPGPGRYFNSRRKNNSEEELKYSYFFQNPIPKKDNIIKRLEVNSGDNEECGFKLIEKKGRVKTFWGIDEENKGFSPRLATRKVKTKKNMELYEVKNSIKNKKDNIRYIFSPFRPPKDELFSLVAPRWKEFNDLPTNANFKVPGPAYYHPHNPEKRLSFNYKLFFQSFKELK